MKKILSTLSLCCILAATEGMRDTGADASLAAVSQQYVPQVSAIAVDTEEMRDAGVGTADDIGSSRRSSDSSTAGHDASGSSHPSIADLIVYDPTYDSVSKKLFNPSNRFTAHGQEHTGTYNFINFINAFFFPLAGERDVQVRLVEPIDTESMSGFLDVAARGPVTTSKLIRFDDLYRCTCYATGARGEVLKKTEYIFNLEMQRSLNPSELQAFNDRMYLYTSRLFNQHYDTSTVIPVRALVIMDSAPYAEAPMLTNSFVMQYVENKQIVNSRIATDKVFSIYVQLPKFVNDRREFIGSSSMQYSMLGRIYNLTSEPLNWIKLYCAPRCGEPQEHKRYKIGIEATSTAYVGGVSLMPKDDAIESSIIKQEEDERYENQIRQGRDEEMLRQGIEQGRAELLPKLQEADRQRLEAAERAEEADRQLEAERQQLAAERQQLAAERQQRLDAEERVKKTLVVNNYRAFRSAFNNANGGSVSFRLSNKLQGITVDEAERCLSKMTRDPAYGAFIAFILEIQSRRERQALAAEFTTDEYSTI